MPSEARYIVFSKAELFVALSKLARVRGAPLPQSGMKRMDMMGEDDVTVTLTLDMDDGRVKSFVYDHAQISAAATLYCLETKIPLPRKSRRALRRLDEHVVLSIICESEKVPLAELGQLSRVVEATVRPTMVQARPPQKALPAASGQELAPQEG